MLLTRFDGKGVSLKRQGVWSEQEENTFHKVCAKAMLKNKELVEKRKKLRRWTSELEGRGDGGKEK